MSEPTLKKSEAQHWRDWESHVFGFGYGTGEQYVLPALRRFLELCPSEGCYDYCVFEAELTPATAWLFINALCQADIIEYGTSPRGGWLTDQGKRLRAFMLSQSEDQLYEIAAGTEPDDVICYPDGCNCGPRGHQKGVTCPNSFWLDERKLEDAIRKFPA